MNAIKITADNVLNLSNADLKNWFKSIGQPMNVSRLNRDEAEAAAKAHFASIAAKAAAAENEGATSAGTEPSAWAFPKADATAGNGGALVVAGDKVAGWDLVEGGFEGTSEDPSELGQEVAQESEEEAAARIEAEAAAEKEEAKARKERTAARASNSLGVALSWRDADTRNARLTRDGVSVTVDGVTSIYRSVAEAFRENRLPFEKHIKFRLILKTARKQTFVQGEKEYVFEM